MQNQIEIILQLTTQPRNTLNRKRLLNDFAIELGWHPSDQFETPEISLAQDHLLVEHGLENTAVISFLRYPRNFSGLTHSERSNLLKISYNNLVDWHIYIERDAVTYVFNRTDPPLAVDKFSLTIDNYDRLRSEAFEQIAGKRPNPNLPSLDDALINTISFWKRNLSAELEYDISNEALSALFNAIIFTRAVEDHHRRLGVDFNTTSDKLLTLLADNPNLTIHELLKMSLRGLIHVEIPGFIFDHSKLDAFRSLSKGTMVSLLNDFYRNKFAPYEYDFSVMSKHALSRIYEHYVSILRVEDSPQLSFFPRLPEEERAKALGGVYTPQFVARFFAKYLRDQIPPIIFKNLKVSDPACGSGIFLRTLLELRCDPSKDEFSSELLVTSFKNVFGIDIDSNATQATILSLSLLYLVLKGTLPEQLNIVTGEAIAYFIEHPELKNNFDAVIANPPYVSLDSQSESMRKTISEFMQGFGQGRIDSYLAFLKIGLEMLKPGGYGLFVVPHSFLIAKSASKLRKYILENAWIRCLADLSAIRVFEDSGAYVILLVFQKHYSAGGSAPDAKIIKCQDLVGKALQDALEGKFIETNFYSIYDVGQETFETDEWLLLPPSEQRLKTKLNNLPKLGDFLNIKQGFVSGADDVFIVSKQQVPKGEELLFIPFLADREMQIYTTPKTTLRYVFYPYVNNKKIKEDELKDYYPKTWAYLCTNRSHLEKRASLKDGRKQWWEPIRPRSPENMLRPKIVAPHLVLVPRFSLDINGIFAISHAPFLFPKDDTAEKDLLRYFLAVLNSSICFWYVSTHSHKYQRGYVMLEPKTLTNTPVPDPFKVPPSQLRQLLALVDKRLSGAGQLADIEVEIDGIISDMYGIKLSSINALRI